MSAAPPPPLNHPKSSGELFWVFTLMGLQGFGGVLTVVQRVLVEERRWLSQEEFVEAWAVAQILPGPNVANLCIALGAQYFGLRGAVLALLGLLTLPGICMLALASAFASISHNPVVAQALKGMSACVAGLIGAVAWKMAPALRTNPMGMLCWPLAMLTVVLVAWLKWPLIWVLLGLGALAWAWAAHCIKRASS